jgi:hypothetical protein
VSVRCIGAPIVAAAVMASLVTLSAQGGRGGAAPPAQPPPPRAAALVDLTGYWVSLVTEDWRYRQFTPPKGDYTSVPLNANGRKTADGWDAAKDLAAGEPCRSYGAAGLMRMPTRLHITWQDDQTLKIETDAGMQTRLLHFDGRTEPGGDWQGVSTATWDYPRSIFPARGVGPPPGGALKVTTTKMRSGYLRRNGVPYGANAVMTEYFNRFDVPGGESYLVVTTEIVDPEYLATPYWTSPNFKRQRDAAGWNPVACAPR